LVGRTVRMDDVQVWMRAAGRSEIFADRNRSCFHVHVSTPGNGSRAWGALPGRQQLPLML
jgi:hypothetical protein